MSELRRLDKNPTMELQAMGITTDPFFKNAIARRDARSSVNAPPSSSKAKFRTLP